MLRFVPQHIHTGPAPGTVGPWHQRSHAAHQYLSIEVHIISQRINSFQTTQDFFFSHLFSWKEDEDSMFTFLTSFYSNTNMPGQKVSGFCVVCQAMLQLHNDLPTRHKPPPATCTSSVWIELTGSLYLRDSDCNAGMNKAQSPRVIYTIRHQLCSLDLNRNLCQNGGVCPLPIDHTIATLSL